jgi:hypothetical protein
MQALLKLLYKKAGSQDRCVTVVSGWRNKISVSVSVSVSRIAALNHFANGSTQIFTNTFVLQARSS